MIILHINRKGSNNTNCKEISKMDRIHVLDTIPYVGKPWITSAKLRIIWNGCNNLGLLLRPQIFRCKSEPVPAPVLHN